MTKLTLSVPAKVVSKAKHLAVDRRTTVSHLVEEGLGRVSEPDLRTIGALTLRAWHHFKDATPFITLAIVAFRDLGFRVDPQKTGFRLTRAGRRYVVEHKKTPKGMVIRVHRWGHADQVVTELNVSELAERVERTTRVAEYVSVIRELLHSAEQVAADAATI